MKKQMIKLSKTAAMFGCSVLLGGSLQAQNVGINSSGSLPDPSAGLDVDFNNKGMLVPRVALTSTADVATIPSPANGLVVYNTNAAMTGGNGVGFYYYCATGCTTAGWKFLIAAANGPGTAGEVLISQGAGTAPTWTPSSAVGGSHTHSGTTACGLNQISNFEGTNMTLFQCLTTCGQLTEGGFTDWRVPTGGEAACYRLSGAFSPPDGSWVSGNIWTTSMTGNLWVVLNESTGSTSNTNYTSTYGCRCVR